MSLLKIAARVAENLSLKTKAIELSTPFTKEDELQHGQYEIEIERENLPIISPALQALIDPDDEESFSGIPSYHRVMIGDVEFEHEPADRSVGIMSDSTWVNDFEVLGIDDYAVNDEDAEKIKEEISLTDKEEESLVQSHLESQEPDYEY